MIALFTLQDANLAFILINILILLLWIKMRQIIRIWIVNDRIFKIGRQDNLLDRIVLIRWCHRLIMLVEYLWIMCIICLHIKIINTAFSLYVYIIMSAIYHLDTNVIRSSYLIARKHIIIEQYWVFIFLIIWHLLSHFCWN